MENPIVILSEWVQKKMGASIITELLTKEGYDHCPVITCKITLPNRDEFYGTGNNKALAKQDAAKKALKKLGVK